MVFVLHKGVDMSNAYVSPFRPLLTSNKLTRFKIESISDKWSLSLLYTFNGGES